jgi:hypothetical protein
MRIRFTACVIIILLCIPCAAFGQQIERVKARQPNHAAFYWGDSAVFLISVHKDAALGGYRGTVLADNFSKFLQGIIEEHGFKISEIERMPSLADHIRKVKADGRTLFLFATLYRENRLHIHGSIVPASGNGKPATVLPYFVITAAGAYGSSALFSAEMKKILGHDINTRIKKILSELHPGIAAQMKATEGQYAQ